DCSADEAADEAIDAGVAPGRGSRAATGAASRRSTVRLVAGGTSGRRVHARTAERGRCAHGSKRRAGGGDPDRAGFDTADAGLVAGVRPMKERIVTRTLVAGALLMC